MAGEVRWAMLEALIEEGARRNVARYTWPAPTSTRT
jgi:hypothetical protein